MKTKVVGVPKKIAGIDISSLIYFHVLWATILIIQSFIIGFFVGIGFLKFIICR